MTRGERLPIIITRLDDPESVSVDERDEALLLWEEAFQQLEIQRSRTLGVFDRNQDYKVFGYTSTVAYLKDRARVQGSRAKRLVSTARAVWRHTATFLSWKHRFINSDQAEMLFQAAERMPDEYPDAEPCPLGVHLGRIGCVGHS